MLGRMGFGKKWMRMCYGMAHFSMLVNGSTMEHFHGSRGLRQGDPLSPFLFLIMAEAFGSLLTKAFQGGILDGLEVKPNGIKVFHLQFADDTLNMCKPSEEQFEVVSGLKVNLHKSRIFGIGKVDNLGRLADCLGCSVGSLPSTYLGLPLRASYNNITSWNPVMDQIQKRLARWKGSHPSKGGKLVLIKYVLASLPTYFLSLL